MGSKIFFLHLHVKLKSSQWVAKLNSCLCFKVEWKSLGQCPKSSYFCHLRLRGLFLGTKTPLVNIEQRSGLLQRWMNRFAFPVVRKQGKERKQIAWIWESEIIIIQLKRLKLRVCACACAHMCALCVFLCMYVYLSLCMERGTNLTHTL